jgi:hypothetical protein
MNAAGGQAAPTGLPRANNSKPLRLCTAVALNHPQVLQALGEDTPRSRLEARRDRAGPQGVPARSKLSLNSSLMWPRTEPSPRSPQRVALFIETFVASVQIEEAKLSHATTSCARSLATLNLICTAAGRGNFPRHLIIDSVPC